MPKCMCQHDCHFEGKESIFHRYQAEVQMLHRIERWFGDRQVTIDKCIECVVNHTLPPYKLLGYVTNDGFQIPGESGGKR